MTTDALGIAPLFITGLLAGWTAYASHRAWRQGGYGADAIVWTGLSAAFFALSITRTARSNGWLHGVGSMLRDAFRQMGWYEHRRPLQIAASVAVVVVVIVLIVWGLLWIWHYIKRYRLAVGLTGLIVGCGLLRFISLHEVDAWNASAPWTRMAIDLVAAAGVSILAGARLRQLSRHERLHTAQ